MRIAEKKEGLLDALKDVPCEKREFVPTMGALHEGHMSLVRAARQRAAGDGGVVVVSIFVNPTQFNDPNDLKNYPRTPDRDIELLRAGGADIVFMPSVGEIYPSGTPKPGKESALWDFGGLDKTMEGATRPGHFQGVAQVVSRLFELVRPARAYFGQKDFQQVAIIREMVRQAREKGAPWAEVEIVECPTVREEDGLAMSSRNALLSPAHRAAAPDIHRALRLGELKAGELSLRELEQYVRAEVERSGVLKMIYFDRMGSQACIAVQAGGVRLIDNMRYDN